MSPDSNICELPPIKFSKGEPEEQETGIEVLKLESVRSEDNPLETMDCNNGNNNNEEEFNNNNDFYATNNMLHAEVPPVNLTQDSQNVSVVSSTTNSLPENREAPLQSSLDSLHQKLGSDNGGYRVSSSNSRDSNKIRFSTDDEDSIALEVIKAIEEKQETDSSEPEDQFQMCEDVIMLDSD